jgi:hypothetical protein
MSDDKTDLIATVRMAGAQLTSDGHPDIADALHAVVAALRTPEVGGNNTEAQKRRGRINEADVKALADSLEAKPDYIYRILWAIADLGYEFNRERGTEYGIRDDTTGDTFRWGASSFGSNPENFPGYTLVTRTVGDWQPLTPKEQ